MMNMLQPSIFQAQKQISSQNTCPKHTMFEHILCPSTHYIPTHVMPQNTSLLALQYLRLLQ
jgi:hypothetical protein